MAGMNEDFGINDPNLLQLIESGINNPAAVAKMLGEGSSGRIRIPEMQRRQDEATKSFMDNLVQNNIARALLSNKKMDLGAQEKADTNQTNLVKEMPGFLDRGVDLSAILPFRKSIDPSNPTLNIATLLGQKTKGAYIDNQQAEADERLANAGYVSAEGTPPPVSQNPRAPRDSGRATSVLAALAKAQANNGKVVAQYGGDDTLIGSSVTLPAGSSPPKMLNGLNMPGSDRDIGVAPQAEQAIRSTNPNLKNAQIAKLPNGKGYVATYKSGGKDVTVAIPADANGRPVPQKMQVIQQ